MRDWQAFHSSYAANAGPTARLKLWPTPLAVTALSSSDRFIKSGMTECHAGAERDMPTLKKNLANNNTTGVARPNETSVAKIVITTSTAISATISNRRESLRSARTPAGSVKKNKRQAGRDLNQ
jgi:hypothetical protein